MVLVPKQQLLISECLKLTVGDTMQIACKKKKKLKLTRILKSQKVITKYCDGILNFEPGMMLR